MAVESTMMPMTLSEIAETVGGGLVIPEGVAATPQTVATSAVTDSREVGEAGVFVAIAGERVDGLQLKLDCLLLCFHFRYLLYFL